MAPKRKRKDYIGFILAAEKSEKLTKEFFSKSKKTAKELTEFFHGEGFTEIELEHSRQIKRAMKSFMPPGPVPPQPPCLSGAHY